RVHRVVAGLVLVRRGQRKGGVANDDVPRRLLEIVVGAEAEIVVLLLRAGVDPAPLIARERSLLVVAGDDVLAQLGTERLEEIAQVADEREVANDGVPSLHEVVNGDDDEERNDPDDDPQRGRHACRLSPIRQDTREGRMSDDVSVKRYREMW